MKKMAASGVCCQNFRRCLPNHGFTLNIKLLFSVPPGSATVTYPVVDPLGIVAVMNVSETTEKIAAVPLNATLVALLNPWPRMFTDVPTFPDLV
jgi:hypothetical protein